MSHLAKVLELYNFDKDLDNVVSSLLEIATEFYSAPKYIDQADLILSLNQLIFITQKYFFARRDERWDLKIPRWITENKEQVLIKTLGLGLHHPILPKSREFDVFVVFGANKSEIYRRLKFVKSLLKQNIVDIPKKIILLSGARELRQRIDGSDNSIEKMKEIYGEVLFETDLFSDMYDKIIGDQGRGIEKIKVHTPKMHGRRPNTVDTIIYLLDHFSLDKQKLLFISRAPTIFEQKAAVDKTVKDNYYEVVGAACKYSEVGDEAKAAYHLLMSFAGMLFESYWQVFQKICEQCGYKYTEEDFKKFRLASGYRNQPYDTEIFSTINLVD